MKGLQTIANLLALPLKVISKNASLCVFMYALGCIVAWSTLPHTKGAKLYENLYPELFFDIFVIASLLTLLPEKIRTWVSRFIYVIVYVIALIDMYCFVKFDSTLTPTMLLLVGETNSREAGEFLQSLVSADVLFSKLGWVLLLIIMHILWGLRKKIGKCITRVVKRGLPVFKLPVFLNKGWLKAVGGCIILVVFAWTATVSIHNKHQIIRLMTAKNIGEVEHLLTEDKRAVLFQPPYRMAFSIYANTLTAQQIKKLRNAADEVRVDSCAFTSPNIVLIIGESFNRHHSQQYGYWQPTTPQQVAMEKTGRLTKYTDVVCPWNLTSFVFKLMFSTYNVGDNGEWCDYPLFPEVFKAADYHTTFITNQFLPKAKEAVYDFSGGFFLNDEVLSKAQFDTRNTQLFSLDEYLLKEYDRLKSEEKEHNLTIFHLSGQHVQYKQRYPRNRVVFTGDDYKESHPHLNARERRILSDYDNAILYNDSVVSEIVKRFDDKDAIVIYVPDHGEECYEDGLHFICRMHSAEIDARLAHAEFDIPFWIYCTHDYQVNHPEIYRQVVESKDRPYMTDAIPHLLMYLGGIGTKDYHEEYNLLSPKYNEERPRILKNTTDYNKLTN